MWSYPSSSSFSYQWTVSTRFERRACLKPPPDVTALANPAEQVTNLWAGHSQAEPCLLLWHLRFWVLELFHWTSELTEQPMLFSHTQNCSKNLQFQPRGSAQSCDSVPGGIQRNTPGALTNCPQHFPGAGLCTPALSREPRQISEIHWEKSSAGGGQIRNNNIM